MSRRVAVPETTRLVLLNWYEADLVDDARIVRGSIFGWLFGLFNQHAVTINGTVHLTSGADYSPGSDRGAVLLGHELFHVEQQREQGWWRFFLGYCLKWRPAHVKRGWEHPLEAPAYQRGREVQDFLSNQ